MSWREIAGTISLFVFVLLSVASGHWFADYVNPPRPDPFTGANAKDLENKIEKRLAEISRQHYLLCLYVVDNKDKCKEYQHEYYLKNSQ